MHECPKACYAVLCAFNGLVDFYFFLVVIFVMAVVRSLRLKMCEIGFIPRDLFKTYGVQCAITKNDTS